MMTGALDLLAAPVCAIRIGLGALLLRAAASHVRNLGGFIDIVAGYRLMPAQLALPAATGLVALQITTGLLLLAAIAMPGLALAGAGLASVLFCIFALAMAINLRRGRRILCGCGDDSAPLSWPGCAQTAALVPLALIAAMPIGAQSPALLIQAAAGGIMLLILHDALRLLLQPRLERAA